MGGRVRAREPSRGPCAFTLGSRLRGSTLGSWAGGSRKICRKKGRLGRRLIKPNISKRPVADVPWNRLYKLDKPFVSGRG